jgi:CHASE2 domain-containing sensor protein
MLWGPVVIRNTRERSDSFSIFLIREKTCLFATRLYAPLQPTVNSDSVRRGKGLRSLIGALVVVLCGFALWKSPLIRPLENASYDYLFFFGNRSVTNRITYIMMDNESYDALHQTRGERWDRSLHAQLLNKLADDNSAMVVLDTFFGQARDARQDQQLASAMKRQRKIVLMAEQALLSHPVIEGARPLLPAEPFYSAARTNWGVAFLDPDPDGIVRRHWPFPASGPYPSLAESAARTFGAQLDSMADERWIRYYGQETPWTHLSYSVALKQPPGFFRDQIVFIGNAPKTSIADSELDKFRTPYSRWTGEGTAGTEFIITSFVNLLNHEQLRRSAGFEAFMLLFTGLFAGSIFPRLRIAGAIATAVASVIALVCFSIGLSAFTNYWFPVLIIVVGQVPVALLCSVIVARASTEPTRQRAEKAPRIPGYRIVEPPFGGGAYGSVWLAQNSKKEWHAIKVISAAKFENDRAPYDREYDGVKRYREICDKHPGLLRVEFVSEKMPTHFYYVMELGDALEPGWEKRPTTYKPRDLNRVRLFVTQKRLPIAECIRIGMTLSDTLDFIHRSGLTHRDIKPENVLFVNGQPKLADIGLITDIRPSEQQRTAVGTPGYMPPAPESPGTPQADIYGLGMVLYVISTGRSPALFPEISATLLGDGSPADFFLLNSVVLQACNPDPNERYRSAREMYCAMEKLSARLESSQRAV